MSGARRARASSGIQPVRPAGRRVACHLALLLTLAVASACASRPRPWVVEPEQRPRFDETRRVCHALTHADDGSTRPEAFDRCMERRGFHRVPWWQFWN